MRVAFRVDSGGEMGVGHVMRCLTLADCLRQKGVVHIDFICRPHTNAITNHIVACGYPVHILQKPQKILKNETTQSSYLHWLGAGLDHDAEETKRILQTYGAVDWLIVDHYAIDSQWHKRLRSVVQKIMVIDDLANRQYDCDLLLDQTYGVNSDIYQQHILFNTTLLLGSRYALLKTAFVEQRNVTLLRRQQLSEISRILVCMGGTDFFNTTALILNVLQKVHWKGVVDVVMGGTAPHLLEIKAICDQAGFALHINTPNMPTLMAQADLAFGAAGSASWERCCLGLPTLLMTYADNQKAIANILSSVGAAQLMPAFHQWDENIAVAMFEAILNDMHVYQEMVQQAQLVCDGLGVARVAMELMNE